MAVYKFKVTIDEDEDVTRHIEVLSGQGFSTFHNAIVEHFNFRKDQDATYYSSDQQWYEGDLIINLGKDAKDSKRLADFIYDPHQRFICITESYNEVALAIELIKVTKELDGVDYPRCVEQTGTPPYYTQPPLQHIPNEDEEPDMAEMLMDADEPTDDDLIAVEAEAEQVDVEMPDFKDLLKAASKGGNQEEDDSDDDSEDSNEDDSHADFSMDDLV